MRILRGLLLSGLVMLAACMSEDEKTRMAQQASTPITCLPGADCDAKWHRARDWVADNSHFPILRFSNREIVTDSSVGTLYPVITVRMANNAQDEDDQSIVFTAECQNLIGCMPTEDQYEADFKSYVNDTQDSPEVDNDIEIGATFGVATGKSGGVPILAVAPGTPAAASGWHAGDRLVKFNGHPTSSGAQVGGMVASTQPGSVFPVQILRGGNTIVTYMRL